MSGSEVDLNVSDSGSADTPKAMIPKQEEEESESSAFFKEQSERVKTIKNPEPITNEIAPKINEESSYDGEDEQISNEKRKENGTFVKNATMAIETNEVINDSIGSIHNSEKYQDTDAEPSIIHKDVKPILNIPDTSTQNPKTKTCILI